MKRMGALLLALGLATASLTACTSDSDVVNKNLDKSADNFSILRRVVFYNAITGDYILSIEGYCSVDPGNDQRMTVTCKVGNSYKRDALGKSDNVLWFYEQMEPAGVSAKHYKVVLKPSVIVPGPEVR